MKKIILVCTLVVLTTRMFCQASISPAQNKEYYLKKSRNQKTVGWVLLGGGLGLIFIGGATYKPELHGSIGGVSLDNPNHNNTFSAILMGSGFASMIGSIPLFISGHQNKKRAASIKVGSQNITLPQSNSFITKNQPTISLSISL